MSGKIKKRGKKTMKKMETLYYNFGNSELIPSDLYQKVWAVKNLWDEENKELLERLERFLCEEVYEINETLY